MSKLTKALTAAAGNAGAGALYAEDVFSTYLYTGDGASNRDIVNGIDLASNGGLVWLKTRSTAYNHFINSPGDITGYAQLPLTSAWTTSSNIVTFNEDGFRIPIAYSGANASNSTSSMCSWTFRKAEKFFDVVTYTGTGDAAPGQTIAHNLGSTPGFIIIKRTDSTSDWTCYHNGLTSSDYYLRLHNTQPETEDGSVFPSAPTDSNFYVRADRVNASGGTFVAYLFASDAGGFGDDGSENIIKCGSWNENSTNNVTIDCGFEPAFVMFKCVDSHSSWYMVDSMRGIPTPSNGTATGNYISTVLQQSNSAEGSANAISLTSNGFIWYSDGRLTNTAKWVYIAIRRPMKTPESGTEVFTVDTPDSASPPKYRSLFPVDMAWYRSNINSGDATEIAARLTGTSELFTDSSSAEGSASSYKWDYMNGWYNDQGTETNNRSWMFKRATGFMDVVAYTGTSVAGSKNHNLGVVPELMFVKRRSLGGGQGWNVYAAPLGNTSFITLNTNQSAFTGQSVWNSTTPTDSVFYLNTDAEVNSSSYTYVAYLFATLAGVSKVGSYTGTGADLNVDCGFSAGARFILIKRTDTTGNWFYWDYQRGITAGNDPYLFLNTTAAQVTNTDYIDPLSSGFTVTSGASFDGLNNVGGTYIFLAIA